MIERTHITLGLVLKVVAIIALLAFLTWYVLFQARSFLNGPVITLNTPYTLVHTERTVPIEGTAENIVTLMLNGREITTDKEGNFREYLVLEDGYTIMTLAAYDRFGRYTSVTQEYVYVQPEDSAE
jgi:hypothetical protein